MCTSSLFRQFSWGLLLMFSFPLLAQEEGSLTNQAFVDSLQQELRTANQDSVRLRLQDKLSETYFFRQQYDSCYYYAELEIELGRKADLPAYIARGYRAKSIVEARIGELPVALSFGDSAIHYFKMANDTNMTVLSINNQAYVASQMNECDLAIQYGTEADSLAHYFEFGEYAIARFRLTYCAVLEGCQLYDLLIPLAEEMVPYCQQSNLPRLLGSFYMRLLIAYRNLENYDQALAYTRQLQDILPDLSPTTVSAYYTNAGRLYMDMGDYDRAYEIFLLGLNQAEELGDPRSIAHKYVNLGAVQNHRGNYAESVRYFEMGLPFFEQAGQNHKLIGIYFQLGESYGKVGRIDDALTYFHLHNEYQDSVLRAENREQMEELGVRYESERYQRELAERELELAQSQMFNARQRRQYATQRRLALLVGGGLLLGLGGLFYVRQNRNRRLQLEYDKRQAELRYNLLRSQMNPHFIFNSLNSIQSFFANQSFKKGNEFLGAFSQLIRRVLDLTGQKIVPLSEELETLELYLQLEGLRLNHSLDYMINLSQEVEPELMRVPPLIFQPFVENAIWHGIAPKRGAGKIEISINYNERTDALECVIEDDGVGLGLPSDKESNHRSRGVAITRERLGNSGNIEILNLGDMEPGRTGVRTELSIPLWD